VFIWLEGSEIEGFICPLSRSDDQQDDAELTMTSLLRAWSSGLGPQIATFDALVEFIHGIVPKCLTTTKQEH
jgi:hypothetical protein